MPIIRVLQSEDRVGGAGNVAMNIASLGGNAALMALVGEDEQALVLKQKLAQHHITDHCLGIAERPTITKLRAMSRNQQLLRLDFEDGFGSDASAALLAQLPQILSAYNVLLLSDYGKGTILDMQAYIKAARAAGIPVLIDPKGTDFARYQNASIITPNQHEFEAVVGKCQSETQLCERAENLRAELNLDALLITRSERGMALFGKDQQPLMLPTRAREVFDVTGAGDTVIATMAAAIGAGMRYADATALANLAAGIVVAKVGTATASVSELQASIIRAHATNHQIVSREQLIKLIRQAQQAGESVVFTNGCFDILHAGHVEYLRQAAALGTRLVVAVNSDASVQRLKGKSRPINPLPERMRVLAALASVDWVCSFDEDTPEQLIKACAPNVLVKGGDYQIDEIAGADFVRQNGGEVSVLSFVEGCSTSGIIEKIIHQPI